MDVSMELRTEKVYTEEKKGPATTQLTFDETYHLPDYLPDKFESGTANLPGYYGWEAVPNRAE